MVIVDQFEMRLVVAVVEVTDCCGRMNRVIVVRMATRLAVTVAIISRCIGRFRAMTDVFGNRDIGVIGGDLDCGFFGKWQRSSALVERLNGVASRCRCYR